MKLVDFNDYIKISKKQEFLVLKFQSNQAMKNNDNLLNIVNLCIVLVAPRGRSKSAIDRWASCLLGKQSLFSPEIMACKNGASIV
jgi:hypothetical protein